MTIINSKTFLFFLGLSIFELFIVSFNLSAATDFYIIPGNATAEIHCDFLSIKEGKASCKENSTLVVYDYRSLNRIIILQNGRTFRFDKEIRSNSDELISAINKVNHGKIVQFRKEERERQREISRQKEKERREQEETARYYRKYYACKDLYDAQCQDECSINKYEHSASCYNICIKSNCL